MSSVKLNEAAVEWFMETAEESPFFAYIHYFDPHAPYAPPEPYDRRYVDPAYDGEPMEWYPSYNGFLPFDRGEELPEQKLQNMVDLYDGSINYADECIGVLLQSLKERELYENTLILVTSDHGEEFFDHGGYGHGKSLHEEVVGVPLIVKLPESLAHVGRLPQQVRHIDILPTILDVCGLTPLASAQGISLLSCLPGREDVADSLPAFSEVNKTADIHARSLRDGRYKVVRAERPGSRVDMLFDTAEDPLEMNNLAEEEPKVLQNLLEAMEQVRQGAFETRVEGEDVELDPTTQEELEGLGYL
jgi:arylsulfatase A-like enzyme